MAAGARAHGRRTLTVTPTWRSWNVLVTGVSMLSRLVLLVLAVAVFGGAHFIGISTAYRWGAALLASILAFFACWRRGGGRAWVVLIVGLSLFLEVRAVADNVGFPVHTNDVVRLERILCSGLVPTHVLQRLFFDPGRFGPLDYCSVLIHWSYFIMPYLVLIAVWLRQPQETHRPAGLLTTVFMLSLVIYTLLPATPPWLAAAQQGAPTVYRIIEFVGRPMSPEMYDRVVQSIADPNPIAALPSVHFAVTFALFVYPMARRSRWAWAGAAYSLAMLWSLVYLGEHYVVDCLLGGLVAILAWEIYGWVHRTLSARWPAFAAGTTVESPRPG